MMFTLVAFTLFIRRTKALYVLFCTIKIEISMLCFLQAAEKYFQRFCIVLYELLIAESLSLKFVHFRSLFMSFVSQSTLIQILIKNIVVSKVRLVDTNLVHSDVN